jgi:hypothetical protein
LWDGYIARKRILRYDEWKKSYNRETTVVRRKVRQERMGKEEWGAKLMKE